MHRAFDARLWLFAVCLLIFPHVGLALGFGQLQLHSALGQPLDAQIPLLSLSSAEHNSLSVHLADKKLYRRFGLSHSVVVNSIDLNVERSSTGANRVILNLSSMQPMKTPLLELLVVAQTSRGEDIRQQNRRRKGDGTLLVGLNASGGGSDQES